MNAADSNTAPSAAVTESMAPPLKLISWRFDKERNYFYVRGQVKNVSAKKLEAVFAVGEFYDMNDVLVKTDDAVVDFDPIMPGQTAPFTVMSRVNPEIKTARISFKTVLGQQLQYTE